MILSTPFSIVFWICYLGAGLSDLLDGFIARRLKIQSDVGARLDSIADLFFAVAVFIIVVVYFTLPAWIWICAISVAVIRLMSYSIGFYKYHTFSSLHTYLNKTVGLLIFLSPFLISLFSVTVAGAIICITAMLSAIEELLLTIKSSKLDRDCKCIFLVHEWRKTL